MLVLCRTALVKAARGKGITMSKRALLTTFHFSARPAEGDFERTIPILLVCGEGLIASVWRPYADMLSARGYCGTIVEMDPLARNTKQITRDIETVIKNCGYWPPIVICHSLSTYIAQKYLESFSLSGLVMINPYPPYSMSLASRILQEIDTFSEVDSLMRNIYGVDNAMDIANLCQPPSHGRLHSLPSLVLREIANDEALRVKLEPASVPMLVIYSSDDPFLKVEDIDALCRYHNVDDDNRRVLPTASRLPMVSHLHALDKNIFEWIESIE